MVWLILFEELFPRRKKNMLTINFVIEHRKKSNTINDDFNELMMTTCECKLLLFQDAKSCCSKTKSLCCSTTIDSVVKWRRLVLFQEKDSCRPKTKTRAVPRTWVLLFKDNESYCFMKKDCVVRRRRIPLFQKDNFWSYDFCCWKNTIVVIRKRELKVCVSLATFKNEPQGSCRP